MNSKGGKCSAKNTNSADELLFLPGMFLTATGIGII